MCFLYEVFFMDYVFEYFKFCKRCLFGKIVEFFGGGVLLDNDYWVWVLLV